MNPSEFERTKPVQTMKKINETIALVKAQQANADSREQQSFLEQLYIRLLDLKETFKRGE